MLLRLHLTERKARYPVAFSLIISIYKNKT